MKYNIKILQNILIRVWVLNKYWSQTQKEKLSPGVDMRNRGIEVE